MEKIAVKGLANDYFLPEKGTSTRLTCMSEQSFLWKFAAVGACALVVVLLVQKSAQAQLGIGNWFNWLGGDAGSKEESGTGHPLTSRDCEQTCNDAFDKCSAACCSEAPATPASCSRECVNEEQMCLQACGQLCKGGERYMEMDCTESDLFIQELDEASIKQAKEICADLKEDQEEYYECLSDQLSHVCEDNVPEEIANTLQQKIEECEKKNKTMCVENGGVLASLEPTTTAKIDGLFFEEKKGACYVKKEFIADCCIPPL